MARSCLGMRMASAVVRSSCQGGNATQNLGQVDPLSLAWGAA